MKIIRHSIAKAIWTLLLIIISYCGSSGMVNVINNYEFKKLYIGISKIGGDPIITGQPANATICKGGTYSPHVIASGNGSALTYQWQYSSNGSTNWSNVSNGTPNNASYANSTSATLFTVTGNIAVGNYNYRCIVSSVGAGSVSINSNNAVLKILPDPTVIVQPISATICVGGTYAPQIIASGGTPSLIYHWQYSPDGFSGWSNVVNGSPNNSSYLNTTSASSFSVSGNIAPGTYYFRCIISSSGSGCNSTNSINAVLTIVASPTITLQPASASLCKGSSYNPTIKSIGGTPTYQWQFSEDGSTGWANVKNGLPANSKYTNTTSASNFTINGNIAQGYYYYRCVVSSNGCSNSISNNAILTIIPDPVFTKQPIDATICVGGSYSASADINSPSTGNTYQWQFSANGIYGWTNVTNGSPSNATYSGATTPASFTVNGAIAAGTYFYRCIISSSTNGCVVYSSVSKLTIIADPIITQQPVSAFICVGGSFAPSITATGGTNSLTYQWQYSANGSANWNNVANGTPANATYGNSNSASLFFVAGNIAAGKYYYRCVVSSSGNGCNSINSNNVELTIGVTAEITSQPISATICQGSIYTPKITVKPGSPALVYQWQYSADGSTGWANVTDGVPLNSIYNNTTSSFNFYVKGNIQAGVYYYRCLISSSINGCATVISSNAVLTVLAQPEITTQPIDATICKAGSYAPGISLSGTPNANNCQWQFSIDGSTTWNNVANGTPSNSVYTGSTNTFFNVSGNINPGSYYYRCLINSKINGCSNLSNVSKLTVVADPYILTQPLNATIFSGDTYSPFITADGGTPSLSYQWQYSTDGSTGWASVTNNTPANANYSNSSSANAFNVTGNIAAGTYYYRCSVSSTGSGCDPVNSNNGLLTVVKKPTNQNLQLNQDLGISINTKAPLTDHIQNSLLIYPNPTNDYIQFETKEFDNETYDVYIYDSMGQLKMFVKDTRYNQFNINKLANGVYIVRLITKTGIMTGKFNKIN